MTWIKVLCREYPSVIKQSLAKKEEYTIRKRFCEALHDLGEERSIVTRSADKEGGVMVLNKSDYVIKILYLLSNNRTCERKPDRYAKTEADAFTVQARKV